MQLGNVIYCASLIVAIPTALFGFWALYHEETLGKGESGIVVAVVLLIVPAVVIWMLGLVLRGILAGAKRTEN